MSCFCSRSREEIVCGIVVELLIAVDMNLRKKQIKDILLLDAMVKNKLSNYKFLINALLI